jgi:hypothetical protein
MCVKLCGTHIDKERVSIRERAHYATGRCVAEECRWTHTTDGGLQQSRVTRRHCCADRATMVGRRGLRDTFTQEDEYRGHWARREAHHRVVYFWPAKPRVRPPSKGYATAPRADGRTLATSSGGGANFWCSPHCI